MAQDMAHATQHTKLAQRGTRAKWPGTLQTQYNTPSEHAGEQEPSSLGHRTHSTTHRGCAPGNSKHECSHTERTRRADSKANRTNPRNAQTAWNGVPVGKGRGHPDRTTRNTHREGHEGTEEREPAPAPTRQTGCNQGTAPAKAVVASSATHQPRI